MNTCHLCQKEFKYPYLLLRHLNRKFTCYNSNVSALMSQRVQQNVINTGQNGYDGGQNGYDTGQNGYDSGQNGYDGGQNGYDGGQNGNNCGFKCTKCDKTFKKNWILKRHEGICRGNLLQCSKCGKMFSSRRTRSAHERNVKCV